MKYLKTFEAVLNGDDFSEELNKLEEYDTINIDIKIKC